MMKLSISQEGIEEALRSYVANQGFNFDISNVDFNKTGRGGQTIEAEIELVPMVATVPPENQATPRAVEAKTEEVAFIAEPKQEEKPESVDDAVDATSTSIFG